MRKCVFVLFLALLISASLSFANEETVSEEQIREYIKQAEQGKAEAQSELGYRYLVGDGVPQDSEKAVHWLREAAYQNVAQAQYFLCLCYMHGEGVPKDLTNTLLWAAMAINNGYYEMDGIFENLPEEEWSKICKNMQYSYLAGMGDPKAARKVAVNLFKGEGAPKSYRMAAVWYGRYLWLKFKSFFSPPPEPEEEEDSSFQAGSTGEGDADETFIRAMKYMTGEDNFPQNSNMAAKLLKEAAEKGHANAQFNLAVCFAKGIGVNMDHGQTLIWLEKAAANGHSQAKEFLEEFKRDGGLEAPADLKEVTEAAEKGDAEAQCKLAMYYYMGQGVPRDLDKMIFWLEKSSGQGFAEAQFRLGSGYLNGTEVPKDERKAAELFAKSAEQGYADGQYSLGLCYENGYGVPKDEEQAIKWYTLAGEQGSAEAQYNLAAIYYRQGSDKEIYWLAKAADQGEIDPATGYRLALHYLDGKVVPKDAEKAFELLKKAAYKNNADAELKLSHLFFVGVGEAIPEDYFDAVFWCIMAVRDGHTDAPKFLEELKKDPRFKDAIDLLNKVEADKR